MNAPAALMDLKKLYAGLVLLGIGYFLGTVTLICEIIYWKYFVENHPRYDKYTMKIERPSKDMKK